MSLEAVAAVAARNGAAAVEEGEGELASVLEWWSDFGHDVGTGQDAVRDGASGPSRKWPDTYNNTELGLNVVSCASVGVNFPSTNCLEVTAREDSGFGRISKNGLTIPGEGESVYYRMYLRGEQTYHATGGDSSNHPIELGTSFTPSVDEDITVDHLDISATHYKLGLRFTDPANSSPNHLWQFPALPKGVEYRFEFRVHVISGDQAKVYMRLYDMDDVLVYDNTNVVNENASSTLAAFLVSNNLTLESPDVALGDICAGLNGLVLTTHPYPELYNYQACFAKANDGWCGPYPHSVSGG